MDKAFAVVAIHLLDVVDESPNAIPIHLVKQESLKYSLFNFDLFGLFEVLLVELTHPRLVLADECLVYYLLASSNSGK